MTKTDGESKKKWKRKNKQKLWKDTRPLDTMKSQDKVARAMHKVNIVFYLMCIFV